MLNSHEAFLHQKAQRHAGIDANQGDSVLTEVSAVPFNILASIGESQCTSSWIWYSVCSNEL